VSNAGAVALGSRTPPTPPDPGSCPALAEPLLAALEATLASGPFLLPPPATPAATGNEVNDTAPPVEPPVGATFTAAPGRLDWGLAGEASLQPNQEEGAACGPSGCAWSNPSSPYGLVLLPLAPGEGPPAEKAARPSTPPSAADVLREAGSEGLAPLWQLGREEVVLLVGCTPPPDASR
jgi:hypothetical protein